MSKKGYKIQLGVLGIILIGVAGWAFYSLLNRGASDLLLMFGVENFYLQTGIIIFFVLIFLFLGGASVWKAFEKVVKR